MARFRITGKQPIEGRQRNPADDAIEAEGWSDLVEIDGDGRRKHMHWVHVRTDKESDRQPESFSRAGFFEHLCQCYAEAYPEDANRHGSIVLFGAVAKEAHKASTDEGCA